MPEALAVAMMVAVPSTITALAAWRKAGKADKAAVATDRKVTTSNGMTIGAMVEHNYNRMERVEGKLDTHIMDPWLHRGP